MGVDKDCENSMDNVNITQAEKALRESEARYRGLFENMLDGFAFCRMIFDELGRPADFVYLEVNGAFGRLTGLKDVKGKKVSEAIPGIKESNPELFEIYGRVALTGQSEKFEIKVKPLGIWLSISVYSPEREYFVAVFDNITERKLAEEKLQKTNDNLALSVRERTEDQLLTLKTLSGEIAERQRTEQLLRQSEERYREVVEDLTETINRFNADGILTFVNEVFCRVFGKSSDELLGSRWQPWAFPADLPFIEEKLRTLSPSNPVVVIENRIYSTSGTIRWMQFVNRGFFDREGRLIETQAVGRDITERKQAEQVLAGIRDELEQQVRERTQSLTESNLQLQREMDERQQIENELLHKNKMLESMAIELSLAEERERDRIAGELHDQVGQRLIFGKIKLGALASQLQNDNCIKEVEELERIIDHSIQDIRTLTFQLRPPLLASAGLEAALHWLGEEFQEKYGPQLSFNDDGKKKPMRYEARSTVFQAAREMLLNTVKHADATRIGIAIKREADLLQVCISDDGRGFDLAEDRAKKSSAGGFGLINVQRRIEHLGGNIRIESRPGNGTCVTIIVPLDISQ